MRLLHPLDDLFAGRSHIRVLRALDESPDGLILSAREVARRAGVSHPTASSVLASLRDQGVVLVRRGLRTDGFELNRGHLAVQQLGPLFDWERKLPDTLVAFLRERIERAARAVSAAYLFGSAVRGDMHAASDIDLAIVVTNRSEIPAVESVMEGLADRVREQYGNRLNVMIRSEAIDQLAQQGRPRDRLWTDIVRNGIPVLGRDGSTRRRSQRSRASA